MDKQRNNYVEQVVDILYAVRMAILPLLVLLFLAACQPAANEIQSQLITRTNEVTGFARARPQTKITFPADHGPHPEYLTEWWYYTGNLESGDGRHFGYQLTFFRRALLPLEQIDTNRESDWATDQVYLGHFAITDSGAGAFTAYERFARGAAGLAGAQAEPFSVWLESWQIEEIAAGTYALTASQDGMGLDLMLTEVKGPVLQGVDGYSQKGPEAGNASFYYSLTRLETSGTVTAGGEAFDVQGLSWMDHEYSTSALSPGQIGWDWFSLQLDDGSELMVYQIRRDDGTVDAYSSGAYIFANGQTQRLQPDDFQIEVGATWTSPRSEARYPSRWTVIVPSLELTLSLEPYVADQELDVSYSYWEGAVKVEGRLAGETITGNGYVEMTGYAGSMAGEF